MMLACVRRLMAASRPGARIVQAKADAADANRRLKLLWQGGERHLNTADRKLYCNVAVPFGEAPWSRRSHAARWPSGRTSFRACRSERNAVTCRGRWWTR